MQVKSDLAENIRASSVTVAEYELANREKMLKFYQSGGRGGGPGRGYLRDVDDLGGLSGRETPTSALESSTTGAMTTPMSSVFGSVRDSPPPPLEEIPVARSAQRTRMTNVEIAQAQAQERATYGRALSSQERGNFRRTGVLPRDLRE